MTPPVISLGFSSVIEIAIDLKVPRCHIKRMKKQIVKVSRTAHVFRVVIPMGLIRAKGWENVTHVQIQGQWGNRFIIEKVATDEESKEKDKGS